jgi:hypothetical protein
MEKHLSIVLVDKRHYRKIVQENWGLSNEQMKGKHVHHRIHQSKGGTNDPTNLYVCSSWFHQHCWHDGEEWIAWATEGGLLGAQACQDKRETDPKWVLHEKERARAAAKLSHSKHTGTKEYSDKQRVKSLRTHISKRREWQKEVYESVWKLFMEGVDTGYKIGKRFGDKKWKKYSNMLKFASLGFTFEQLTEVESYLEEINRLNESPISHLIDRY